jgi:hypothetical protein
MPAPSPDRPRLPALPHASIAGWLPFLLVAGAYAAFALHQITLPGVYMDAVNPDYLAVRVLNRSGPPVPAYVLGGNYFFDRFPVLSALHHGTQTFWLGLPAFWLFGTTVAGLRITHALFALGILAALYALLGRAGVGRWWAAAVAATIAVDPTFVYAFRTQSYITTAPIAWMFVSLYALHRTGSGDAERRRRWTAASGFLAGLAFAGYFVHLFFAPAVALAVLAWPDGAASLRQRLTRLRRWCGWFAVGALPYVIGWALMVKHQRGFRAGLAAVQQTFPQLAGPAGPSTLGERFDFVANLAHLVVGNGAQHWLIFGQPETVVGTDLKTALLLVLPPVLWILAEIRGSATPLLRTLVGMQASFAVAAACFGARLAGHHYMPVVPVAYATLGVALACVLATGRPRLWRASLAAVPLAILGALNVTGAVGEAAALARSGGVGTYSDAINTFAADLLRDRPQDFVVTPDWGLVLPAIFLTGGNVEITGEEDIAGSRRRLCAGRNVSVALIQGDRLARLDEWRRKLDWGAPALTEYRQRDGAVAFVLGTFHGSEAPARCAAPAARPASP